MSNHYAFRIESRLYSGAAEPCGTGHAFSLNVFGIKTPAVTPEIEQTKKGTRYIPGTVYGLRAEGANTGHFYELGNSLTADVIGSKGLAIRGLELARPQYENQSAVDRDDEVADVMRRLRQPDDEEPVVVTFLDKYALLQGIVELADQELHPQSYGLFIQTAISAVLSTINASK